jgi:glycosyltransferase involved in cell wall biosynthesis
MLRHAHKQQVDCDWTFYCALGQPGPFAGEARALNAQVVPSRVPLGSKSAFVRSLRAELQAGRYDVLHSHHDLVTAVYWLAAAGLRLHRRILHVHNADDHVPMSSPLKQSLTREPLRRICLAAADRVVGNSNQTLNTFLHGRPRKPGRDVVLHYGVEAQPLHSIGSDRRALRHSLGLPEDALILLFAGRITPEKNPVFAVDVLAALRHMEPRAVAVFAGDGSLEPEVRAKARQYGLEGSVRFLGWRTDVADLMSGSDWFILPHPECPIEGFGLAVVEAQLAGLRLLISPGITDDPLLPRSSVARLPLDAGANAWASAAVGALQTPAPSRAEAAEDLAASPMQMDRALTRLMDLYG